MTLEMSPSFSRICYALLGTARPESGHRSKGELIPGPLKDPSLDSVYPFHKIKARLRSFIQPRRFTMTDADPRLELTVPQIKPKLYIRGTGDRLQLSSSSSDEGLLRLLTYQKQVLSVWDLPALLDAQQFWLLVESEMGHPHVSSNPHLHRDWGFAIIKDEQ